MNVFSHTIHHSQKFSIPFYNSDYGIAFSTFSNHSCYSCAFKGNNHQADITLGDYWGLTEKMSGYNRNGVSILIVRTQRGQELINKINTEEFSLQKTDAGFAVNNNQMYFSCKKKPKNHEKFFEDLKFLGLHRAVLKNYGYMRYIKKIILIPAKRFLKSILRRKNKKSPC